MLPLLDEDQAFFRDTTARFLDELAPADEMRRLRGDPAGFDRDYWRRGAELGWTSFLVAEDHGGGSISGQGAVDLTLVAHEFGRHAAPGPLSATNVVAGALSDAGGGHADVLAGLVAGELVATWCFGEPAPGDGLGSVGADRAGRRRRPRARRRQAAGRGGRERRPPAGHRPERGRAGPGPRARRRRGHLDRAAEGRRPHPPVLRRDLRRRPGACRRRRRRCRAAPRRRRAPAPARPGHRQRRVRRGHAGRLRHDRRVDLRPLLVRPPAGVVPGAQAPLRRHEDVARGQPRRQRRGAAAVAAGQPTTPASW